MSKPHSGNTDSNGDSSATEGRDSPPSHAYATGTLVAGQGDSLQTGASTTESSVAAKPCSQLEPAEGEEWHSISADPPPSCFPDNTCLVMDVSVSISGHGCGRSKWTVNNRWKLERRTKAQDASGKPDQRENGRTRRGRRQNRQNGQKRPSSPDPKASAEESCNCSEGTLQPTRPEGGVSWHNHLPAVDPNSPASEAPSWTWEFPTPPSSEMLTAWREHTPSHDTASIETPGVCGLVSQGTNDFGGYFDRDDENFKTATKHPHSFSDLGPENSISDSMDDFEAFLNHNPVDHIAENEELFE